MALGDLEGAAEELVQAYMLKGEAIFDGEDPKYLAFLKSKVKPPPGGW
jgi:hypothetical protein